MRSVGEGQAALSGPLGLLLCARARGAASARLGGGIAPADGQPSGLNPETGLEFEPAGVRHGRCPVTLPAGGAQAGELCSNLTFDAFGTVDIKLYIHIDRPRETGTKTESTYLSYCSLGSPEHQAINARCLSATVCS